MGDFITVRIDSFHSLFSRLLMNDNAEVSGNVRFSRIKLFSQGLHERNYVGTRVPSSRKLLSCSGVS